MWPSFKFERAREVEEAGNDGIESVHLAGNISGHFGSDRVRRLEAASERLGRPFNDRQGVANFMGQACGELAQSRQPF